MNEWLKKGVDEKENAVFGVDYSSLLAQNDDDKSKAFDALAHTLKDVDFNFDVLAFNNQNDKAKAFDSLKNQNAMFLALNDESEQERNQRAKANAKVREDIAVLNDDGASYDEKINAREGYYDYLLQFGGDKELIKAFKDEVVLPYYENAKKQLFSEAVPFGENEKALDFKKRVAYIDQKINDLKYTRPYKDAQYDGLSDDEIKKNLGQRKRSFTEVGEDILGALGHLITATPLFDTVFNPADDKNVEHAKLDANLRALSLQASKRGQKLKISDLSPQEQARAYMIGYASSDFDDKITDLANAFVRDEKTYNEFIQKGLDIILKEAQIAQTEYEYLSDEQRQFLYEKAGVLNRGWDRLLKDDDEETLKQSYDVVRGGALMKIASDRAESIKNFAKTHNLAWLGANYVAGSDEVFDQEYQKFKDDLNGVALDLNFDGVDNTGQYFYKTDENGEIKYYKLNDGFFDNLGNIFKNNAGSLVGALGGIGAGLYLAKKGKLKMAGSTLGETGAAITGSLLGSGVGGASDYINYALRNGKDIDFNTLVTHATQEGLFSLVGDAAALGLSKLANTTASKGVFNTLIKTPSEKIVKGADTLIAKFPVAGALTSPVRNFFKGQNIQAAEELVMKNFTPEQRMDIQNALKELGGGININPSQKGQFVADFLTQKYGNESPIAKTARDFADAINMKGFRERQSKLLQFVISDESGKNLGYVMEMAKTSPEVQRNLENMVKYSALQLENALKKLDLPSNQFKAVFKDFEKGTEKSFDEAMELIGEKMYPGSVYKTKVDKAPFDDFLKSMNDEKIYMGDAEKRFMKEVIEPLFDEKGVSFAQLNNIRKQLNSKFKDIQSPNFKDYLRGQVGKKLREAVDKGINDILKQNPKAYAQVKELYDTALKDYSAMKDIQTIIKKHNFYKQETDFADDLDKLLKFIIKGKGDEKTPNLERILGQLTPANRAVAEVNILKQILENTRVELAQQFGKNQTHTYFTRDFVDKIDELAKKGSVFKSKEAQEFIQLVKDWHTLNKNHADILYDLRPADVKNVRQGIATRIQGRLEQMRTNILMSNMFRLLDKIPFASGLWDKTQAGALRFHIKNALSNSVSIDDFKLKLLDKVEQGKFDNKTKQLLREIIGEADNAEKTLNEMQRVENEVLRMSDDELIKRDILANLEKSPQFGRDMFILGEENLSGDIVKWTAENNKRVAINKLNPQKAQELGFKYPNDVRRTISADEIRHTLNNHGVNSNNVKKSGQPPVDETDIANYQKMSDTADETLKSFDNDGHLVEVSFKQVNGYYVVIEQVRNKNNEFSFKTMFKGRGNYKDSEAYTKTAEKAQTLSQGYEPSANSLAKSADENIIPNSSVQSQAPQKSLLDLAREETERLRQAQIDKELAQKEAEIAHLKEMKAQQEQIIAQKESKAGLSANEAQRLEIGESIPTKLIKPTKIIISDSAQPFEAEFVIAKKSDIKPNFERTGTQGRSEKQSKVIDSIQSDFKPHLIFEQSGGFEGLPIITKDGQVIAGNHRAEAINALSQKELAKYKQAAKEKFGVNLADDEVIVRLVADENEKDLINLAFMSNVGRESNLGEKALSNLAKFESQMSNLPNYIKAESVDELQNIISKTLDKQGAGLNTFDTNLALFSKLAKNSTNNDILDALNQIQNLSAEEKSKILKMFVDNAGSFYNLAKDSELKNLDLRPYLNDSLVVAAKSYATRAEDYTRLLGDISHILSLSEAGLKETLKLDKNLFENLKSKALGLSFARFARLENPSAQLFDFLKNTKANLEDLNSANLFDSTGKKLDELDIYDFLKHSIAQGRENEDALKIIGKLDELREVEKKVLKNADESVNVAKNAENQIKAFEFSTPKEPKSAFAMRKELREFLEPVFDKPLTNANDGRVAVISKKKSSKLSSSKAAEKSVENGFSEAQHFETAKHLPELYENAKFKDTMPDKNGYDNLQIHHYTADFVLDGEPAQAKITLKEIIDGQHAGNRIYTIELESVAKLPTEPQTLTKQNAMSRKPTSSAVDTPTANPKEIIPNPSAQSQISKPIKSFANFYENSPSDIKSKADKKDLQVIYEFLNDFDFEKDIIKGTQNAKLAKKINELARKNPSFSFDNGKTNELYNLDNYIDFIDNPQVIKAYATGELHKNLAQAGFFVPKESAKQANFAKNALKIPQALDNIAPKDNALIKVLKKQAHFEDTYSDKDILTRLYIDEERLAKMRNNIEQATNATPLKEFGTNYAEFYKDGQGAVKKLLAEAKAASEAGENFNGQVAGAFHREDLGDITLAWGEVGTGKSDGFGLAKIEKYHPEVLDNLTELVEKSPIVKESDNRFLLDTPTHFLAIRKEFDGQKENWLLTAFEKDESIARRRTDLPSSQSEVKKTTLTNTQSNSNQNLKQSQDVQIAENRLPNTENEIKVMEKQAKAKKAELDDYEKDLARIHSPEYQNNLKEWAKGSSKDFLNENGNVIGFSPEKFVAGFLGGAGASKSLEFLAKKAKTSPKAKEILNRIQAKNDIITGNFFIKGKSQMAQKPQEPRFEVTKTLEKTYRNAQIIPKKSLKTILNLNGRVVGDFIKLAQKHPEYFANPKEAQELCQSVLSHAKIGIKASNEGVKLIIAPVKDKRGDFGGVALRIQNINGEHRIRSVLFMDKTQVEVKLKKTKELGEPILQF